ncbi:hypothetical protein KHA80_13365 [Anaerobacillus sp. HL2]|nr:hypothetical protein KHA80_13365 [Anaerobacillus sp. HL2]
MRLLFQYRIMVVKSNQVFDLARNNTINVNNYAALPKTGGSIIQRLSGTAVDVDGDLIRPDIPYRVYILSVSNAASTNALSIPSSRNYTF